VSLVLYAVTEGVPECTGGELRSVSEGSLTAVVGDEAVSPSRDMLWRYEQVVERLMRRNALLPARFGSVFTDEDQLRAMLRRRRDELERSLDRVKGAVELAIRSSWSEQIGVAAGRGHRTGTDYMLGRLELQRRARDVAQSLDRLAPLARDSHRRVLADPSVPLVGAYLVDRERVPEFTRRVAELDRSVEEIELVCTGPWPPYSFAQGGTT
jgi:Gas vesicle synthesis protein GvpL/GvpF